jgi:dTDP-4-amino-4,6-dideoxygalactose transaminase
LTIPILDLKAHHEPLRRELLQALERVLDSNAFILGAEALKLEADLAAYCQTAHAVGVSSGTDALLIALMALDVGPGDEVVTTPFSFFATAGVVARLGARPVFVDIEPASYNLDPSRLAAAITPRTKALIPVHLYGQCADMAPILQIAAAHGVPVIEDAAQAIGAEYPGGRRACSMGLIGCLSFFPTKNLGALGDAGMVMTDDAALAEKMRVLRTHGSKPKYSHKMIGGNFRLDEMQAAVLNVKLAHLDRWTRRRQENAARYHALFQEDGRALEAGIELPAAIYQKAALTHYHIYNQYVIRAPRRDALCAHLQTLGIATEIYYPIPFHLQECFRNLGYAAGDFPEAERAAAETVALPIYPELTPTMQSTVVAAIGEFYRGG